ncbi:hypothetical protein F4604DRAFT_1673453 [Suillus subluteus]|nr:hypothetical protein F4604DRAFT_1673453 [Suillus subluteus]
MLPHWGNQRYDSSEPAGHISGPSGVTWSGNQQIQESHSLQAHLQWPGNQQLQESHSLQQAHLQWLASQEPHSLQAQPCHDSDLGLVVHDYESCPGPSSWPQWLPGHAPDMALPHTQSFLLPGPLPVQIPHPQLHPSLFHRILGGDCEPPPPNFDEVWPQLQPCDIPTNPLIPYPSDPHPKISLDPFVYANLPPSSVTSKKQAMKMIPWGTPILVLECQEEMKWNVFNNLLLPMKATIASSVNSLWKSVAQRQSRDNLWIWATSECSKDAPINKLVPIVDQIQDAMVQAARIFVYYEFGLNFDYAVAVNQSHVTTRGVQVQGLIVNDVFLHAIQSIEGVDTSVAFSHLAIIVFAAYLLYDTTLYHWALFKRRTGTYIRSKFSVDSNRSHHDRFVLLFQALTPAELAVLKALVANRTVTCAPN